MDLTEEERRQKALDFYKEKFDLDLKNFSPQKTKLILEELKKQFEKALQEEEAKNKELNIELYNLQKQLEELIEE